MGGEFHGPPLLRPVAEEVLPLEAGAGLASDPLRAVGGARVEHESLGAAVAKDSPVNGTSATVSRLMSDL